MRKSLIAVALSSLAIGASAQDAHDVQILPFGQFSGRFGTKPGPGQSWTIDNAGGRALAAKLNARHSKTAFNFDYEHQSLAAMTSGQPAPAAGWAQRFEWRDGVGLFALGVQWTERAAEFVAKREYQYLSPVILSHPQTHEVQDILNVGLTNNPELLMLDALSQRLDALNATASLNPSENEDMNFLQQLIAALGLPAETTEATALTAVAALKVKADKPVVLTTALSAALGLQGDVTEAAALSAVSRIKGTDATTLQTIRDLQTQVNSLQAAQAAQGVDGLVQEALSAGKLVPAMTAWATEYGKTQGADALRAYLASVPANGLTTPQSKAATGAGQGGEKRKPADLSESELAICSATGITAEEYLAAEAI